MTQFPNVLNLSHWHLIHPPILKSTGAWKQPWRNCTIDRKLVLLLFILAYRIEQQYWFVYCDYEKRLTFNQNILWICDNRRKGFSSLLLGLWHCNCTTNLTSSCHDHFDIFCISKLWGDFTTLYWLRQVLPAFMKNLTWKCVRHVETG